MCMCIYIYIYIVVCSKLSYMAICCYILQQSNMIYYHMAYVILYSTLLHSTPLYDILYSTLLYGHAVEVLQRAGEVAADVEALALGQRRAAAGVLDDV